MEPPIYKRRFEELERSYNRIKKLYNGKIINEEGEDSFQSPKDIVLSYFRVVYELKESLKKDSTISNYLRGYHGGIETFCNNSKNIALALDIANQAKHVVLKSTRSGKIIGKINSHIHIFSPDNRDRTEITIEVDGEKEDCLGIVQLSFNDWKIFLKENNLI